MQLQPLTVFNFSVQNATEETVDINIDGYIVDAPTKEFLDAYWGDETSTSFKSFRDQIPSNVKTINIRVNSGGGHVGDAMAMYDYLQELETKGVTVNRRGTGIVASAATYLVMGNNSEMTENSWFMVHNVSGYAYGDVNQVENQARTLRKFNDRIVAFYAAETGLSETVISNMMNKETWLTAQEAKEKGFVANVTGKVAFTNAIKPEHWNFQNTAVLNAYNSFTTPKNSDMENKLLDAITNGFNTLAEKLGLKEKAGEEATKNAFTEFATAIQNAVKDGSLSEQSVTEIVNKSLGEALKNLNTNEAFTNAIAEATKNTVSKEDLQNAVKDVVNKSDLTSALTANKDEIVNAISDKLGGKKTTENKDGNEQRRTTPRNRFSGQYQAVD